MKGILNYPKDLDYDPNSEIWSFMFWDNHDHSLLARKVDQMSQLGMEVLYKLQTNAQLLGVIIIPLPHNLFSIAPCT